MLLALKRSLVTVLLLSSFLSPGLAAAEENFSVAVLAGIGGALDSTVDADFGGGSWQAMFTAKTRPNTSWSFRLGELNLEASGIPQLDTKMSYFTLAGEYRFSDSFFESGMFFGLGYYEIDGSQLIESEGELGLNFGVTGEFEITERVSLMAEFAGHLTDLSYGQFFVQGLGGIAFHF